MNYMRLLKLLYIAERESLRDSGKPLTGSVVVALERGPVLEDIYKLILGQHTLIGQWSQFFRTADYHLEMVVDPGAGRLSKFVAAKLGEVTQRHFFDDEWAMVQITHELPEWKRNNPGKSSKLIPLVDILEALGLEDRLDDIVAGARADQAAKRAFSD